jgi:hypothetical protein
MMLEVSWDGLWTLSFGLAQFHGHGSLLTCEVALMLVVAMCWLSALAPLGKFLVPKKIVRMSYIEVLVCCSRT